MLIQERWGRIVLCMILLGKYKSLFEAGEDAAG